MNEIKLMSIKGLAEKMDVSETYIKQHVITQANFPSEVRLKKGGHPKWFEHEVNEYLKGLKDAKNT